MKHFKYIFLTIILSINIIIFSSCMPLGLPTLETYSEYISGVVAYEQYSGEIFVPLNLLTNETEFDGALLKKPYYSLEIKQIKACYIKAVALNVTTSKNSDITFQAKAVLKNRRDITDVNVTWEYDLEEILAAEKININSDKTVSVLLFFPKTLALRDNSMDKLYIIAAENEYTEETCEEAEAFKVPFKFDSLLVFFDPEYM